MLLAVVLGRILLAVFTLIFGVFIDSNDDNYDIYCYYDYYYCYNYSFIENQLLINVSGVVENPICYYSPKTYAFDVLLSGYCYQLTDEDSYDQDQLKDNCCYEDKSKLALGTQNSSMRRRLLEEEDFKGPMMGGRKEINIIFSKF